VKLSPTGTRRLRTGRHSERGRIYHVTTATIGRLPVFEDIGCARRTILTLKGLHDDGYVESLCFVLMPDHLHWLFRLSNRYSLARVVAMAKSRSARSTNQLLGRRQALWQRGYYDRAIRRSEDIVAIARYIVGNPVRARLVASVLDYPHWDAVWFKRPCRSGGHAANGTKVLT